MNLWYHVGSKDEERRQRGFAHLFEHLMFEGSEHYPGDFFKPLQRLGASINGSTSSDRTNYYEDVPAAHVELALAMESDRMGSFLAGPDRITSCASRRTSSRTSTARTWPTAPTGMAWRMLAEAMFPPGHPYSWTTIGVMEDVEAAGLATTSRRSSGATTSPATPAWPSSATSTRTAPSPWPIATSAGSPVGTEAQRVWAPSGGPGDSGADLVAPRPGRARPGLPGLAHRPPLRGSTTRPLVILGDILGRGKSGRLYRKLVVDRELAQDIGAHQSGRELAGTFGVTATLRPGRSWEEARDLIDEEIASIAERGVEESELARVKNGRTAGFIYALDNVGGFGGVADRLNAYNTYLGDPGRITSDLGRYREVTSDSVREAASTYLHRRPRACLSVVGRKPSTVAPPLDRSVPPSPSEARPYRAPRPEVRALKCGVPLWVLPSRDLPIVAASFVIDAGASTHGPDRGGLASLTADMLDEGTASRSSHEIALAIEGTGTSLSASAGWDGAYVGLQCLTDHLEPSLDLAVDLLRNPSFPEGEWKRIHAQALAGLKAERDSAEARAGRAMLRALYDPDHPYRVPSDGDEVSVAGLALGDLREFHRGRYRAGHAACVVAGDVDPDQVAALLDDRFAGWSGEPGPSHAIPRPPRSGRSRLLLLDRPGAPQSVVRVGHLGTHRLDPDFMDLTVWNQILGGQFTSRLNAKLREEKGFTYGVRSHFDFRKGAGPFVISASLQSDRLAEALEDLRGEVLGLLGDRPPTLAELEDARRSLIEGQARHFETPSALVSRYAGLFLHGLPDDYHARFAERIGEVRPASMEAAAARHVDPSSFVIVVVADAQAVLGPLEQLGWAQVERFDERDEPTGR